MSHEATTRPLAITYSDYDWGDNITSNDYNYFYVPSIPEWAYSEFDGLLYEGTQYNWSEVDYRLSVEYSGVPESADVGLFMGLVFAGFIVYKILEGKGINVKDTALGTIKKIYNKITKK